MHCGIYYAHASLVMHEPQISQSGDMEQQAYANSQHLLSCRLRNCVNTNRKLVIRPSDKGRVSEHIDIRQRVRQSVFGRIIEIEGVTWIVKTESVRN